MPLLLVIASVSITFVNAQQDATRSVTNTELGSESAPILLRQLPDQENVKNNSAYYRDNAALRSAFPGKGIIDHVDLSGDVEAVSADYPAGRLLLVEYMTPQASVFADGQFQQFIAQNPTDSPVAYRRIGNYSAFVFDAEDAVHANALLDQIRYEKEVQWLGEDPFLLQKLEIYLAQTGRDVVISTMIWTGMIFGLAVLVGIAAGLLYFRYRESKRASMKAFSDAGGLTRLNLDDLSEPLA